MRRNVVNVMMGLFFSVVFGLAGCGGGGGGGGSTGTGTGTGTDLKFQADVPTTTKVVNDATVGSMSVNTDGTVLTFPATTETEAIKVGDVIVSNVNANAPNGIIRKVGSISKAGNTISFTTSAAKITDVVTNTNISIPAFNLSNQKIASRVALAKGVTFKSVSKSTAATVNFEPLIVMDSVALDENTKIDGSININPSISLDFAISNSRLSNLKFTSILDENAKITLTSTIDKEIQKEISIAQYRFSPFTIWAGYVPIVITPVFEVKVGAGGKVSIEMTTDVTQIAKITGGIKYQNNNWEPFSTKDISFEFTPPTLSANASAKAFVKPQVDLLFYGIGGPYLNLEGYLSLNADINTDPWWTLSAGVSANVGVKADVFDIDSGDKLIVDFSKVLATGKNVHVTVKEVDGTVVGSAAVSVTKTGSTFSRNAITNSSGYASLAVPSDNGYTLSVSKTGYNPKTSTINVGESNDIAITLEKSLNPELTVTVKDSNTSAVISGANVSISGNSQNLTGVSSAAGTVSLRIPANSGYTLTVTKVGYTDKSQTITITSAATQSVQVNLTPSVAPGTLKLTVKDAVLDTLLADVSVAVTSDSQQVASGVTGVDGSLSLAVNAGTSYVVTCSKSGYQSTSYSNITITSNVIKYLQTILQIDNQHTGNGAISGKIINALTGAGISGAAVKLYPGINTSTGSVVASATTDSSGNYTISAVPAGNYSAEVSATSYSTGYFTITSIGGITRNNQNYTLTPTVPAGQTRIVLTWGASPYDLDSHLTGPLASGGRFHVYYNVDTSTGVNLDRDDTDSYGPETTTITSQISGVYRYSVHNYSNRSSSSSTALSTSGAKVSVLRGNTIVAEFNVPGNSAGTLWTVFEMNGDVITPINTMGYNNSSGETVSKQVLKTNSNTVLGLKTIISGNTVINVTTDATLMRNLPPKK